MNKTGLSPWRAPILIMCLGLVSTIFGAMQLFVLNQGAQNDSGDTPGYFFETPLPIVIHLICGVLFNFLGPLQFAPVIRQRWPVWHRYSGRILILCGLAVALSASWMNHFYPPFGGLAKYLGIMFHNVVLLLALGLGLAAILRRDIANHRKWMMRVVAVILSTVTQRLLFIPWFFIVGEVSSTMIGVIIWFGVLFNLGVVEWVLFRERNAANIQRDAKIEQR